MVKWIFLGTFLLISVWSSAQKIETTPPQKSQKQSSFRPSESIVYLPIRIQLSALDILLADQLPKNYSGKISSIPEGKYKVYLGRIQSRVKEEELKYKIPFKKGYASGVVGVKVAGELIGLSANINSLSGHISLLPNIQLNGYHLTSDLSMWSHVDHAELQACKYFGWPIKENLCSKSLNITSLVDGSIEKQIDESKSSIQRELNQQLADIPIKSQVSQIWDELHGSFLIDSLSGKLWLNMRPKWIMTKELQFKEDYIELGAGVRLITTLDSSKKNIPKTKLQDPVNTTRSNGYFRCNAPLQVSYSLISAHLRDQFVDYTLPYKNKKLLKIKDIYAYGGEKDQLVVAIKVDGLARTLKKAKGWIYVKASLEMDETNYQLKVASYELDAETNHFLLDNGLELMANKTHYEKILKKLSYDLKPELNSAKRQLNRFLVNGIDTGSGILKGELNNMSLKQFKVDEDGILISTTYKGSFSPFYLDLRHFK